MAISIHFSSDKEPDQKRKVLRLRLEKEEECLRKTIYNLSGIEIKEILGFESYESLKTAANGARRSINAHVIDILSERLNHNFINGIEGTYRGGIEDFFHSLFPYLEAFSPSFVNAVQEKYAPHADILLDPFGGLGTAPFTFSKKGKQSYYCEINPLMLRIFDLKKRLKILKRRDRERLSDEVQSLCATFIDDINNCEPDCHIETSYYNLFNGSNIYNQEALNQVLKTRTFIDKLEEKNVYLSICLEISVLASLVPSSNMQRAGDLRCKRPQERKKISSNIFDHIYLILKKFVDGLVSYDSVLESPFILTEDARQLKNIPSINADVILTSPPYLNGTNYFRNTKIELWFLNIIKNTEDLGRLRDKAISAGINDIRGIRANTNPTCPQFSTITNCVRNLEECAYDRRIPQMVKWYASDIYDSLNASLLHLKNGGIIAVDIGDSIYCGVNVPTDKLIEEILIKANCRIIDKIIIRSRTSRSGMKVFQTCIIAEKEDVHNKIKQKDIQYFSTKWNYFKKNLPHQSIPYSKRNWGHPNHSICSYQGKMKPSLAYFLVDTFVPENGKVLDPFAGVGTIPFEGALNGHQCYGFDISPSAFAICRAKLWNPMKELIDQKVWELENFISDNYKKYQPQRCWLPNFNSSLSDYYHQDTLKEILAARDWFHQNRPWDEVISLILACSLHILHGNRPYALSRRSHPITPFSPKGDFVKKSYITKLKFKIAKTVETPLPSHFVEGMIYFHDATLWWPSNIHNLDAIITSPPFFDSTRFYLSNWIRLWFAGWEKEDFEFEKKRFIDEKQKISFDCYEPIFRQARERLKTGGVLLLHLGKSHKCNMAMELIDIGKKWFNKTEIFDESVEHCETHGIRDKGTVSEHQYLLMY